MKIEATACHLEGAAERRRFVVEDVDADQWDALLRESVAFVS